MKLQIKSISIHILLILMVLFLLFILFPNTTLAQSIPGVEGALVTCGIPDTPSCEFCDLLSLSQNIINASVFFSVLLAVALMAYIGFLYITAGGSSEQIQKAHRSALAIGIGLIIVLGAWMIVDAIMSTLLDKSFGPWNRIKCADPVERPTRPPGGIYAESRYSEYSQSLYGGSYAQSLYGGSYAQSLYGGSYAQSLYSPPVDTTPPVITILGANPVDILIGEIYTDAGARAFDRVNGDLTASIVTTGLPIDTGNIGTFTVTYTVTDSAGNTASATRTVNIIEPFIDKTTDMSYLRSCFFHNVIGECAIADLNGDGSIDPDDEEYALATLAPFDVNEDFIIEYTLGDTIQSCFIKEGDVFCEDILVTDRDNDILVTVCTPIPLQACAFTDHGDLLVTESLLFFIGNDLTNSLVNENTSSVHLGRFWQEISTETLGGKNEVVVTTITDTVLITYATVAQFDFNGDGIADLSGGADFAAFDACLNLPATGNCANMDTNEDGWVSDFDLFFLVAIQDPSLPSNFTIKQFEKPLFDWSIYTDKRIIEYCANAGSTLGTCKHTDVNKDTVTNSLDLDLFDATVPLFDLNGDGVINGF